MSATEGARPKKVWQNSLINKLGWCRPLVRPQAEASRSLDFEHNVAVETTVLRGCLLAGVSGGYVVEAHVVRESLAVERLDEEPSTRRTPTPGRRRLRGLRGGGQLPE